MVHPINACPSRGIISKLEDIVFTKADANWVPYPYEDVLVVTAKVANSFIHKILVDNGSPVNILYWDAYQKTRLTWANLSPTTSPLYRFSGDHVVPEGTIKLVVTLGEHPRVAMIMTKFLAVNYLSTFNGVLGKPPL